jgi:hypothetical protein
MLSLPHFDAQIFGKHVVATTLCQSCFYYPVATSVKNAIRLSTGELVIMRATVVPVQIAIWQHRQVLTVIRRLTDNTHYYASWSLCQFSNVPGRCFNLWKLIPLLLCKLDPHREAYGNDDTSALNFRFTGDH